MDCSVCFHVCCHVGDDYVDDVSQLDLNDQMTKLENEGNCTSIINLRSYWSDMSSLI